MNRSDWIALAACIAAFLGLIPSFYQVFQGKKEKKRIVEKKVTDSIKAVNSEGKTDSSETIKEPMPPMMRAFFLVLMAFIIGLIELILFSAVAHYFDVKVDIDTMTLIWKISFFSLFIVPGALLFFALMVISTLFSD